MIVISNLKKSFGTKAVLTGVNLTIPTGDTMVIIGASGCGKSVLLKHIVGLLEGDEGKVEIDGLNVAMLKEKELFTLRRKFGFLFQGAALFDSMTVLENVALGLVENGMTDQKKIERIVESKLEMVGLPGIGHLKPAELSGGMKKRVGLARALSQDPEYIFYDEPTTGLDPIMADQIDDLIASITRQINVTSVVVTHDMFSVERVAKSVVMMHQGVIYFNGTPQELQHSADPIVRAFVERYQPEHNKRMHPEASAK